MRSKYTHNTLLALAISVVLMGCSQQSSYPPPIELSQSVPAGEVADFRLQHINGGVYAFIGPTTDRTPENLGLNNNIGFVDTPLGWVLIDSGSGNAGAQKLHEMARAVKDQPIHAVITIGSQDHRWLGNDYFAKQGAKIYAFEKSVSTQLSMQQRQLDGMIKKSPANAGTEARVADQVLKQTSNPLDFGGVLIELNYYGDAHFEGDSVAWLPKQGILFTGDIVYVDRMLGVHPWSNTLSWNAAYQAMRRLPATYIVPGHGRVTDWTQADKDTGAYLERLVTSLTPMAQDMVGVDEAVSEHLDWPEFKHLVHYDSWHRQNINRTYSRLEKDLE